jgi:hypothetical protein
MSDAMKNDPGHDKPAVPTWFVGCVGWLVLIIGGLWYWNYWTDEIKKKNEEAVAENVPAATGDLQLAKLANA